MIPLRYLPSGELDPQWHGEVHQDAFAFEQCGGINNGTFLDLGCWEPKHSSNSLALEQMGWRGLLVDCNPYYTQMCKEWGRTNPIITARVEDLDWKVECFKISIGPTIDYLSMDIEGAELTVLQQLFMAGFRFRVITIEHNAHNGPSFVAERNKQRALLSAIGYKLAIGDVQNSTGLIFEDWWTNL